MMAYPLLQASLLLLDILDYPTSVIFSAIILSKHTIIGLPLSIIEPGKIIAA
jgi:hypothetical protein